MHVLKKIVLPVTMAFCAMSATAATYTQTVPGHNGPMTVKVAIDNGKITAVEVVKHSETAGVGTKAIEALPAKIVKANSTKVDVVTGASVSSKGILMAVNQAVDASQGKKVGKAQFKPGTYKASAYGNNGYLNVEVTVTKDKITDIKVPGNTETRLMGGMAIETMAKDIIDYQTVNVDAVSGATVTSGAFKQAVIAALEKSGVNLAALQTPVPVKIKKFNGTKTENYDLVIVGSGGAGLSAAVTAAEAGNYKVVVLEKMPVIGGNTLRCASAFNAADPERQKLLPMTDTLKDAVVKAISEKPANADHAKLMADVKAKYEAYLKSGSKTLFDCPEWHALQTYNGGDKVGHIPLIRTYAENVLDTLHWMQKHGTPVMDRVSQGAGALWQRTHQVDAPAGTGLIEPLLKAANKEGVKIVTGMRAQELITRNGEVVGVKASDKVGNSYEFKSKYGVILATGGYSQNKEMRQKSSPVLTPDMVSTNQPGATGDGIVMATKIGADLTGMNYVQVYPLATPGSGALQGRARKMSGLDDVIDVNKNGQRFVKEDARRDERGHGRVRARKLLREREHLRHRDRERERRVLHEGDDLVADGGNDALHHLRQDDAEERAPAPQAERLRGLPLPDLDGEDAAPVDLREIRRVVQREREDRREEARVVRERHAEEVVGREVDEEDLEHQRRAAHDADVEAEGRGDGPRGGHAPPRDDEPQRQGQQQGEREDLHRDQEPGEQFQHHARDGHTRVCRSVPTTSG